MSPLLRCSLLLLPWCFLLTLLSVSLEAQQANRPASSGERNFGIVGTVLRPDGTPAEGAEIAVGSKGNSIYANNGQFDRERTPVVVKADTSGKFSLPDVGGQFSLLVFDKSGWAILRQEDFDNSKTIQLLPFYEFEGKSRPLPDQKRTARMDCYLDSFSFGKGGREKLEGYVIIMTFQTEIQADGTYKFMQFLLKPDGVDLRLRYHLNFYATEPVTIYQDEKQKLVYPDRGFYKHPETVSGKKNPLQGKAIIPEEWKDAVKTSIAYLYFEPDFPSPRSFEQSRQRSNDRRKGPDLTTPPLRAPRLVDLRQDPYEYVRVVSEEVQWGRANGSYNFGEFTSVAPLDQEGVFLWDAKMGDGDVYLFLRPKVLPQESVEDKWVAKCYLGQSYDAIFPDTIMSRNPPGGLVYFLTEKTVLEPFLPEKITLHLVDENGDPVIYTGATAQFDGGTTQRAVSDKNGRLELVFPENMRGGVKTFCTISIFSRQQENQSARISWERRGGHWDYIPEQLTVVLSKKTEERDVPVGNSTMVPLQ